MKKLISSVVLVLLGTLPAAAVAPAPSSLLPSQPDWVTEGNQANAVYGARVAPAGDVNGDGFADFTVSSHRFDNPEVDEGKISLFFGSATGPSLVPDWTFESDQANAQLLPAESAGDVNGDGFGDLLVGAGLYDNGQTDEGRAWLFLGSPSGPSLIPDWTAEGDQATAIFGNNLAAADVNADGFSDVFVGASGYDLGQADEGVVFVYMGSASGLPAQPSLILQANQASAAFSRVRGAGDVNGDGYDDVLVGAPFYDNGQNNEGRVYVFKGSATGLKTKPLRILEIDEIGALFGNQLEPAGDINGDGYDDIMASALGVTADQRVFVYLGRRQGPRPNADTVLRADQISQFGIATGSGDFNGDGFEDVIVGARFYAASFINQGRAFVFLGSSSGLSTTAAWTFDGEQASEELGSGAAGAGDVNGDGFDDALVGAHAYDNPDVNEGRALLFFGSP